jgi:DNA invertase Pin-like site-specific DNA recombinase
VKQWAAPFEYVDNGVSGSKALRCRDEMKLLITAIEAGEVDALIVPALDRLGRTTRIILGGVDFLAEHGVTFVSCRESFDTSNATGQFVLTIFAALAQMERDTTAGRTKSALAVKQTRDGEVGGKLPYGYLRTPDRGVIVDDVTAAHARRIVTLRRQRLTMRAIAAAMNADGVPSPKGGVWWASSVREVLRNVPAYRGGKRGGSEVRWPRILK